MGSAYWSGMKLPIPYPLPFGSSLSAFWLVNNYDGSDASSSLGFTHELELGRVAGLGFQLIAVLPRFTFEIATLIYGGHAVTVAPTGRDLFVCYLAETNPHGCQVIRHPVGSSLLSNLWLSLSITTHFDQRITVMCLTLVRYS